MKAINRWECTTASLFVNRVIKPLFAAMRAMRFELQLGRDWKYSFDMALIAFHLYTSNVIGFDQGSSFTGHATASKRLATVQKSFSIPAAIAGVQRRGLCHFTKL